MSKLILCDFDETITEGTDETFYEVCKAVFGSDEWEKVKEFSKEYGKDKFTTYIECDKLTKDRAKELWDKFKKTGLYRQFIDNESKSHLIKEILNKGEKIPDTGATEFYIKKLLRPLIALYDVYVKGMIIRECFFELYEKSKKNDDILVINTYKKHKR